ncbi:MAG: VWA domain-containing protein, partial [Deltaproteobacteria bacterium]|nr:VWA domain-containing protein [Deltaproteobacteria bacterium]
MYFEAHQSVWFFWILPVILVAFVFLERQRLKILYSFFPKTVIAGRLPEYFSWHSVIRFVLFFTALALLGFALLKPYSDYEMREVKRKGVDLYFLVDLSQSMLAQDVGPSRIGRAQREITDFIKALQGDRVGLIGFAGTSYVFVPLTVDYAAFDLFTSELSPDAIPINGTDIKGALQKAVESFKTQTKNTSKAVMMITDGEDSVGLDQAMLDDIKKMGVKVFVIGIGTEGGAPIPLPEGGYKTDKAGKVVITKLDEPALQRVAMVTGGGYVRSVTGDMDLEQIYFNGIKKAFEDAAISVKEKKLPVYEFQLPVLIAFLLLALEIFMTNKRWFWVRLIFAARKIKTSTTPDQGRVTRGAKGMVLLVTFLAMGVLSSSDSYALNPFDLEEANDAFFKERYQDSLKKYLDIVKENPSDTEVYYNLGDTYYRLDKFKEAEDAYKKALNTKDIELRKKTLYNLGNTAYRKKELKEALDYYAKALEMEKNYLAARLNYDYVKKQLEEQEKQEDKQCKDPQKKDEQNKDQQNKDQQNKDEQNKDEQNKDQ